jgi:hypothetical protein
VAEQFIMKMIGGVQPGVHLVDENQFPWPLPGMFMGMGGRYFKVRESDDPPQENDSAVIRCAVYQWYSDEEIIRDAIGDPRGTSQDER